MCDANSDAGAPGDDATELSAFEAACAPAARSLFAWASVRIPAPLAARLAPEDLVQESLCRAFEQFASFDATRGSFKAWLFGIATNVFNGQVRRLNRLPEAARAPVGGSSAVALDRIPAEVTSLVTRAGRRDELEALHRALAALPEDERKLLLYRGLEGATAAEAGALLGIGEEAAAKRWQRLRARLVSDPLLRGLLAE